MAAVSLLEAPSSAELLHVPQEVTARNRLAALIRASLITEFPVNRSSEEARLLTPDEAMDLLLSPGSPWERHVWWSAEVRSLLEKAVRSGRHVTHRYLLSRLQTLNLPRQNISSLGEQMSSLCRLTSCSLASNELTEVRGGDLPRSLSSLQLYGNRLSDSLAALLTDCPPLQYLGLGRVQLADDHMLELTLLLSSNLPSLRVLDLCDNHLGDLAKVTNLVTTADNIRSINLAGNPACLSSGYYQHFLAGLGRLRLLDGVEMTETVLASLAQQLQPSGEPEEPANKKKKSGRKKSLVKKSSRRPATELDPARYEPSLTSALIRITGAIYLPFVPKDQWPGQELCVVFQWAGDRRCPSAFSPTPVQTGESDVDRTDGLCPMEALLQDKSDVTVLETPLEWHCPDLRALRDAALQAVHVEVFRREKWTPPKKPKKGKDKDSKKGSAKGNKKEEEQKERKGKKKGKNKKEKNDKTNKPGENEGSTKQKDSGAKDGSSANKKVAEVALDEDRPPPEVSLGSLLLPVRALLRPSAPLLLQGVTSSAGAPATLTEKHWTEAVLNIQEEKKEKKALLKKAEKDKKANKSKRMSASARSGSSRKKEKPPDPVIRCFFSIELYRKPSPESGNDYVTYMPIDDLE